MVSTISDNLLCIGVIVSAKGIQGLVKIKYFTEDPFDIEEFDFIYNEDQTTQFKLHTISVQNNLLIAQIEGVKDRNQAEALRNVKLFVKRSELPVLDVEEFYHSDLIGIKVKLNDGKEIGIVKTIENFGAGDLVEITSSTSAETVLYPFTKKFFPEINLKEKYLILNLPEEG